MNSSGVRPFVRSGVVLLSLALSACQGLGVREPKEPVEQPLPEPVVQAPLATHEFQFDPDHDDVVGELQVTKSSAEDTFSDIARRFNVGYEELVRANPGIDPWLPGEGREIVVPTRFVLPDAPREGLVINLAAMRVYYFPKRKDGELQTVLTHPIGIGKVGWSTPEGTTKVTGKAKNPTWFPPASVRKEHAEAGDPLPRKVPPGPDNPLGTHMMTLGWPSYLVHGTNKPYGVGMRSSHGCMRFYPEDIAQLYDQIAVGTAVHVVNQPLVFGWHKDGLYVQAFPVMEDDQRQHPSAVELMSHRLSTTMQERVTKYSASMDTVLVERLVSDARGIATPVNQKPFTFERYLASARHVENELPSGATWDGREELLVSAEEFEATRAGVPIPKTAAKPKAQTKPAAKPATATKPAAAPATTAKSQPAAAATTAKTSTGIAKAQPAAVAAAKPQAATTAAAKPQAAATVAQNKTKPATSAAKSAAPAPQVDAAKQAGAVD
ncbi:MAG TPA: L,D-transpeptidase family protein [Steroidobacteraceae bacterium]|nr:L,D-transpeptidase family protein [Steroidobacteraceae bacterium]